MWVNAKINGKTARLVFDTGCSVHLALFRPAAQRLDLKLRAPENQDRQRAPYWLTDECTVKLPWGFWGLARAKMQLSVFDFPSSVNQEGMDGAVGWPVFNRRILELNAAGAKFRFLKKVPREALAWTKLRVQTVNGVLALEVPDGARSNGIIFVDTGSPWGVDLSPEKWGEWKAAHPNEPTTLTRNYNPQTGWFVREQAWSDRVSLEPLELTDVMVEEAVPLFPRRFDGDGGIIGLAALKRLDCIVDGKEGVAYLRPKVTPESAHPSEQESPTLIFMPREGEVSDLVAHVAQLGSAFNSGIRNGDVLLKIGERDVVMWRSDPGERWSRNDSDDPFLKGSSNNAVGAKLEFTLKRGNETIKMPVVLREVAIYAPRANSRALPSK